jgi:hypothetical protein
MPIVATIAGVSVLGESLHWYEPVGALVILLGVAVTQGRLRLSRRTAAAVPEPVPAVPEPASAVPEPVPAD